MSSQFADAGTISRKDPDDIYLWRFRIQRLDAEIVRDAILAASGALNRELGGPPVFPPLQKQILASMDKGIWLAAGRRAANLAAQRLRLSQARPAVPDVRSLRPAGPEHHLRTAQRVHGTDSGAYAAERRLRAAAGEAVRRRAWRRPRRTTPRANWSGLCDRAGQAPDGQGTRRGDDVPGEQQARGFGARAAQPERVSVPEEGEKLLVETRFSVRCRAAASAAWRLPGCSTARRLLAAGSCDAKPAGATPFTPKKPHFTAAREVRHLAVHERRRQPRGHLRPQARPCRNMPASR